MKRDLSSLIATRSVEPGQLQEMTVTEYRKCLIFVEVIHSEVMGWHNGNVHKNMQVPSLNKIRDWEFEHLCK